jgi:hypothetical protein
MIASGHHFSRLMQACSAQDTGESASKSGDPRALLVEESGLGFWRWRWAMARGERGAASSPVSSEWRLVCINTLNRRLGSRSLVSSDHLGGSECRCHLSIAMLFSSFSCVMISGLLMVLNRFCERISIIFALLRSNYNAAIFQHPTLRQ